MNSITELLHAIRSNPFIEQDLRDRADLMLLRINPIGWLKSGAR
jgi:hypothetical protein